MMRLGCVPRRSGGILSGFWLLPLARWWLMNSFPAGRRCHFLDGSLDQAENRDIVTESTAWADVESTRFVSR